MLTLAVCLNPIVANAGQSILISCRIICLHERLVVKSIGVSSECCECNTVKREDLRFGQKVLQSDEPKKGFMVIRLDQMFSSIKYWTPPLAFPDQMYNN